MSQQFGGFLAGLNYVIRALSGGRILLDSPFNKLLVRSHNTALAVADSMTILSLEVLATTDATATAVATIAVPTNGAVGGTVHIIGKRTATPDTYVGRYLFGAVSDSTTVTEIAAESGSVLENSAGTPAVTVVIDDTAKTVIVKVAGISSQNWKWYGWIEYGTLVY